MGVRNAQYECQGCHQSLGAGNALGQGGDYEKLMSAHNCTGTRFTPSQGVKLSASGRNAILGVFTLIGVIGALLVASHFAPHAQALLQKHHFTVINPYALPVGFSALGFAAVGSALTLGLDHKLNSNKE